MQFIFQNDDTGSKSFLLIDLPTCYVFNILGPKQCCSCHATQQDDVLPGRSNRQQSTSCWASQHETQHETPEAYSWATKPKLTLGGNWDRLYWIL